MTAADEVAISAPGRDTEGLRDGFPVKGKLLVSEVKGGSAVNTGARGAAGPWAARATEARGLETFTGALRLGSPDRAGLRQVDRLMGTDVDGYAWPSAPDKPKVP